MVIPVRRVLLRAPPAAVIAAGNIAFTSIFASGGSSDGGAVLVGPVDTTGADFFVMVVADYEGGPARTVSDNKGNTWNPLTDVAVVGDTRARLYWSKPTSVGSGHTFQDISDFCSIVVAAFSGVHATPADVEATGTGSSSTASAGAGITPTQNNELVIAAVGIGGGSVSSINSGFTIVDSVAYGGGTHYGVSLAYKIQTSAAAVDPDWTLSGSSAWAAAIASFKSS